MLTNNIAYLGLQWLQKPHGCLLLWCVVVVAAAAAAGGGYYFNGISYLKFILFWGPLPKVQSEKPRSLHQSNSESIERVLIITVLRWKQFYWKRQEIENQAPLCLTPRCLNDLSSYLGQSAGKLTHWKQNHSKVAISTGLLFNENIWLVVMLLAHLIVPYFNFNLIYPFLVWGLLAYFSLCNSGLSWTCNPPAFASWGARITGSSHCAQPLYSLSLW